MSQQNFETFGKYVLLEKLATGGMAEVFLARGGGADNIGKFIAMKRILPQFAESPEFIDMFKAEAKIAMNLSHSNIVSIYEFGVQNNQFFLVMDYVEGRNLRQIGNRLKKNSANMSIDQMIYIIREVAAGLDHAHRCLDGATGKPLNITHRDISPQNIMISFEGEVKIVDFGIAKAESQIENTRAGTLKGKFGYMSPEQADGQNVDLRTDIFSLGIVLWELLANERLFVSNNEINTLRKIKECQIPSLRKLNPNVPQELETIIQKALTRDRNLRYQTAAAFHRDLSRFLNRQYPDFSPHDFSIYIKTLFADEILENRKRLIDYAKVKIDPAVAAAYAQASQTAQAPQASAKTPPPPSDETNSFITANSSLVVSAQTPESSVPAKRPPEPAQRNGVRENSLVIEKNKPNINGDMTPRAYYRPAPQAESSRSFGFLTPMILIGLLVGGYYYTIKNNPAQFTHWIRFSAPVLQPLHDAMGINSQEVQQPVANVTEPVKPNPSATTVAPNGTAATTPPAVPEKETSFIIISSQPSGAEIELNGVSTGRVTPSRIEVPNNQNFKIALKKSGYIDYMKEETAVQGSNAKIVATLQKALVGYVDIDARPPQNVIISINGKALTGERLPIENYAVPAGVDLTIKAENVLTGAVDQQVIRLSQDGRQRILLDLRKSARSPSGK